jgi:Tfp pilus assembly protein PilF
MATRWSILMACFVLPTIAVPAAAQRASTPAPPSTITRPGSLQDSGLYDYWTEMSEQGRAGGVLLGKLTVEGEPLPWEPIFISVLCRGTIFHTTQTDPKGRFVITSDHVPGALSVQGDAERQMETHYQGCTVQASLSGYRSSAITITQRNFLTAPDLGIISLSREGRGEGTAVSRTSESAPADARKAFEKARSEVLDQKTDRAQQDLQKAVAIYPSYAAAWFQLGMLQETSNPRDAEKSFSRALDADPKFVLPYEQRAALAAQDGKWKEVVDNTSQVLQLDPLGSTRIWYYDALGNFQLGRADAAKASAMKSLAMDPQHTIPNTEQLLAVVLVQQRNYAGALEHLRNCLTYLPAGANADLVKQQIAQIEPRVAGAK